MSDKLTRKEIKQDSIYDALVLGLDWIYDNWRKLVAGLTAVVVLILAGVGWSAWQSSRNEKANEQLSRSLMVVGAPIVDADPTPGDERNPSFADEASREARARELLNALREDYSGSDVADVAGIHLAQLEARAGNLEEAQKLWETFLDHHPDHLLSAGVRLSLLRTERSLGKAQEVADELRKALDGPGVPGWPEDVVLYELASTLEDLERYDEALESYRRIGDEFPDSAYAGQARQRVTALEAEASNQEAVG